MRILIRIPNLSSWRRRRQSLMSPASHFAHFCPPNEKFRSSCSPRLLSMRIFKGLGKMRFKNITWWFTIFFSFVGQNSDFNRLLLWRRKLLVALPFASWNMFPSKNTPTNQFQWDSLDRITLKPAYVKTHKHLSQKFYTSRTSLNMFLILESREKKCGTYYSK